MLFERTPEVAGQRISGKMQQQPGRRIERRDDVHHQLLRRACARHHHLEAERARFLGGCLADREQRQLARLGQRRVRLQRAQAVAAGGDQRLHAVEIDGIGIVERHLQQRLDGGLMPALLQRGSELERIGLRACDEQAHQVCVRKKVGPGLGQQLGGGVLGQSQRLLGAAFAPRCVRLAAIGREDHAAEDETAAGQLRQPRDRRAAGALQLRQERALRRDGQRGRLVVDRATAARPSPRRRCGSRRRWRPAPRRAASDRSGWPR